MTITAPHRPAHRGVTLIEMMVVIGALAILLGLCAVTIQLLMRVSSDAQARRGAATTIGRLAERFRADVHACEAAELRAPAGLRLRLDPRATIDYEAGGGRITRVESVDGKPARRESYVLGRHDTAAFERRDDGPRRFVALVVGRKERPESTDPARPMEVLASVGRDHPSPPRPEGAPPR
jgi:prepilin-type N-terminal cleavage/methylation domain-containing protein